MLAELNFDCHLLQNSLLGNVYNDSIIFSMLKSTMEVICINAVEYRLPFPVDVRHCFIFNLRNRAKAQELKSAEYGRWETITVLLLATNCGFQGHVGRWVVMMKEPVVVVPKLLTGHEM
jgi:hypothetical protein